MYKGKDINTLTREELIEALKTMGELYFNLLNQRNGQN